MKRQMLSIAVAVGLLLLAGPAVTEGQEIMDRAERSDDDPVVTQLIDREGNFVGEGSLRQAVRGVLIEVSLEGLPEGEHALHIHETGKCEPPFESAGGHFGPGETQHGLLSEGAMAVHAGDLPNIHIDADGKLTLEVLATRVTLREGHENSLLDRDGSALVIHEGADDYRSDPAGAAGPRIACGVIAR